jgi:uncharacterized protein (DUF1810 family)
MRDPFDLQRFVYAQEPLFEQICAELRSGRKRSHWIWFIFPQIKGLGRSAMDARYALGSLAEAQSYLAHPILGPRLRQCVALVNAVEGRPIAEILAPPDDLKFRSSLTLFAQASDEPLFVQALEKYFAGERDPLTLERLGSLDR